ncbi:MAG: hypothetical protein WCY29_11740 [Novosphingobium sp.]
MRLSLRLACVCLVPLALAACKGEKKPAEGTAQGEVLPGSISDAMLPLDTVRSQPPLAPLETPSGRPAKSTARETASEDAGPVAASEAAPPATPAATPSVAADADR